jgi:hypothetical protein
VDAFVFTYSFKNEKLYGLYFALTNDPIKQQPFWNDFCKMVDLRNDFAHNGKAVPPEDAASVCAVARKFIVHLSGVLQKTVNTP